jgi:para-nitrobenzyl esterase
VTGATSAIGNPDRNPLGSATVQPAKVRHSGRRLTAVLAVIAFTVGLMLAACSRGASRTVVGSPVPTEDPSFVHVAQGMLRGNVAIDHRLFAGIPYAAPPVGSLRFEPPAPAIDWAGVRDASEFGPRCIQDPAADPERGRNTSEDCLSLNVWTPPVSGERRPVMVWIHGGAFVNGSSGLYDARWLAARGGIVVVTINYRLGTLGFLAHPGLGPVGDVGNYGMADQQAALRWVHDNIAAFGGDPGQVTIAGESAGGMSVCDHLVAPGSAGLFRAAILMSAPCQAQGDLATAQRRSLDYAADVGCPDPATAAACLRALPVDRLRKPVWYYNIGSDELSGPISGTKVLPVAPLDAFAAGQAARVPVLLGTTRDEFTLFVALRYLREGERYTADEYPRLLAETFGADADKVAAQYPQDRYGGVALAYSATVTDSDFACVADRMAGALSGPAYVYEFNDRDAPSPEPFWTLPFPIGASHSLELRYLFDIGGAPPLNAAQQKLSDAMIDDWSRFVASGSPGWPASDGTPGSPRMSLQSDGSHMADGFEQEHQCPFWAGLKGR